MTWRYFVILGAMRTGSNLLEELLSTRTGSETHGELFNPHFIGKPNRDEHAGVTLARRDADPIALLDHVVAEAGGLPGFRLFLDHDPRVIDHVLQDRTAAKIVLSRRAIDSFVSLQIARSTGQWWLGDATSARSAKVDVQPEAYAQFVDDLAGFHRTLRRQLQRTGQTAFHVHYDDLADVEVIDGLADWLGLGAPTEGSHVRAKVQNPAPLSARLTEPDAAARAISAVEAPDLDRPRDHEPPRGPGVRRFLALSDPPRLYLPIPSAAADPVSDAMRQAGATEGMTQKDVRQWQKAHPGHVAFTRLSDPIDRALASFDALRVGAAPHEEIRDILARRYGVDWDGPFETALDQFLTFLVSNLDGQTSVPVSRHWASQSRFIEAMASVAPPHRIFRPDESVDMATLLPVEIAEAISQSDERVTKTLRAKARRAYRRDCRLLGL